MSHDIFLSDFLFSNISAKSNQLLEHVRFSRKDFSEYYREGNTIKWEFKTDREMMYINIEIIILKLGKEESKCSRSMKLEITSLDNNK